MKKVISLGVTGLVLLIFLVSCTLDEADILRLNQDWKYASTDAESTAAEAENLHFTPLEDNDLQSLERLIPEGEGFLWLKTSFPSPFDTISVQNELLSIYLGRITMADKSYVNTVSIGSTGSFPPDLFSAWNMHRAYHIPEQLLQADNSLLIKVYVGNEGSIIDTPFIGTKAVVERHWRMMSFISGYLNMGISMVMLVISLYHIWLFVKRTQERENLYFALLNMSGAVYLLNFFVMYLPAYESWTISFLLFQRIVANGMLYVLAYFTMAFVRAFLKRKDHHFLEWSAALLLAIPMFMSFLLPDYAALREYRAVMLSFLLPVLIYVLYMAADSAWKKNHDAVILLIGISPLFLTALADIFLQNFLNLYHLPYIGGFGFPLMIFSLLFILAGRFAEARTEAEDLNINLEKKVGQRTEELQTANTTLEQTLSQLQAAQEIAAKDMEMAVRVQQSFYPKTAPSIDKWSSGLIFQPASGVAGDLYDFFHTGESLEGAVLFDVSGHGISSGLVAMLAKTIIARGFLDGSRKKLSEIMQQINDSLIEEKGGIENYMTGLMIRIDGDVVELVSAGHPELILFDPGSGRSKFIGTSESQGSIVGVPGLPVEFPVMRFRMKQDTMLLAYSDALNESCNEDGVEFGQEGITKALMLSPRGMSSQETVEYLSNELQEFMGPGAELKDDLTILALHYVVTARTEEQRIKQEESV
ncbi:PP2C family protein-serine/threonine phosphatase [Spirochaeta dissipatitropha]